MRRLVLGLAGVVAIAAGAASLSIISFPREAAGGRLLSDFENATGLTVRVNGPVGVSLFPAPHVRVEGVSLSHGDEPPFVVARALAGRLAVGGLLLGRLELAEVTLDEPQIALDRAPYAAAVSALRSRSAAAPQEIRVTDGRITWKGKVVDRVEAGLAVPGDGGPLALSGFGRYAGRAVEATVQLADLAALARGARAPFRARIEGGDARFMFDGEAADVGGGGLRLVGDVSMRAADLVGALGWLGARPLHGAPSNWSVSFAGRGQLDADGLQISNAELDLSGRSFLGAGRVTSGADGPAIEATLDAGSVDLAPYLGVFAPELIRADGAWSPKAVDLGGLRGWTLDLRLSADDMRLGGLTLEQPAVTVAVARGGLDLAVGEATAYGGAIGGRLSVEPQGEGDPRMRFEGVATDVALGDALQALTGRQTMSGTLTADAALESRGGSLAALAAGLKGRIGARVESGALESGNRSRTLALAGLGGRIEFTQAEAKMSIEDGVAHADPVTVEGSRAAFTLSGDASFVDRTLALAGYVRPTEGSWTLPVRLEGPLFAPKLKPDLSGKAPRGEARRGGPPLMR